MRLLALVPVAVLLSLGIVCWLALRESPGPEFGFWEPPETAPLEAPALPLGSAAVLGRLVDANDQPVPDAVVAAVDQGRLAWARSSADGTFALTEVAPGPLEVSVAASGFVPRHARLVAGEAAAEIALERAPRPPLLPELAWSDLTGRVEGLPGPGYELAFTPEAAPDELGGALPRGVAVEASGRFVVPRLAHGDYGVRLLPPWARGADAPDLLARLGDPPRPVVHPPAGESRLTLTYDAGEIQGRVRASAPGRFEYVEGALVLVTARLGGGEAPRTLRWPPVATDAEGAFLVTDLPPGEYDVSIVAGHETLERHVTVHAGATTRLDL